jgi:cell division protease FtsH
MAMAGKAAEVIKYGEDNVTSGAASDIQQVSKIARAMVTQFGFSDKVGHIDYANQQESYLGSFQAGASNISPETQAVIDAEVRRLIDEAFDTAKTLLTDKSDEFERIAQGLLEYETLNNEDIAKLIAGEPLDRDDDDDRPTITHDGGGHSAIPKAGKPRRGDPEPDGGMEPQPN